MSKFILIFLASAISIGSTVAKAQDQKDICDGLDLTINAVVTDLKLNTEGIERFCDRIRGMHQGWADKIKDAGLRLEKLEKRIEGQEKINKALSASLPPRGSVLLVDDPLACPEGWHDVTEREPRLFSGRSIVAAGSDSARETRIYRQTGGSENHKLTAAEMPKHNHPPPQGFYHWWYKGGGNGDHQITNRFEPNNFPAAHSVPATKGELLPKTAGSGDAHNNMPPYIALYFCKKD